MFPLAGEERLLDYERAGVVEADTIRAVVVEQHADESAVTGFNGLGVDQLGFARRDDLTLDGFANRIANHSYVTTNEVRSVPADPHETTMAHRPGVVLVPTFHVHEMRLPRFG